MPTQAVVVLSDLHLAPERGAGSFRADTELAACLRWIHDSGPAELVLAGDTFDFMVPPDGQAEVALFDIGGAPDRLTAILDRHDEVVGALAKLTRSPHHTLTILGGNHDPELALPDVQRSFTDRLGTAHVRWLVHGQAATYQLNDTHAMIEHGDLHDPWNRIDHEALRAAASLASRAFGDKHRYRTPPGTRMVHRFVNPLRREGYAWVDALKPERRAVVPILWSLLPVPAARHLASTVRDVLAAEVPSWLDRMPLPGQMARRFRGGPANAAAFHAWLRAVCQPPTRGRRDAQPSDKLVERLRAAAQEDTFFDLAAPDEARRAVAALQQRGWDLVIGGHTHAAKAHLVERALYVNTGTWTQLLRLPLATADTALWRSFLDRLRERHDDTFTRPTLARVTTGAARTTLAELVEWSSSGPRQLSAWRHAAGTWTEEP